MRVPISWLKEYVDVALSADDLADLVTNAGLEVEKVEKIGIDGAELVWDRERILLGHILRVEEHPNADTLVLAHVDYGAAEPKVVVTGAPNLKPLVGQGDLADQQLYGAIILEGATYLNPYKNNKPTTLKGKALRGIYNDSMLCSQVELGVGDDHDGIMILRKDAQSPKMEAGMPLQDVLGDAVIDIDIIPNVARAASIVGVAREVAALTGKTMRYPDYNVVQEGASIDGKVKISTENPDLNPRFVAYLIEGVRVTDDDGAAIPSPWWMQRRLELAGQRPKNVVVDISNYVMLEIGQPNHTFDYDFLKKRADDYNEGEVHLITRLAHEGETLQTLDGKEHELHPNNILVTDPAGNLSLGGIMGGLNSEISDSTTNVLLEAAAWNFINIRHSQRQLTVHSEAGFRFSRGVHPSQALLGAQRAAELLRTLAGGTVAQGHIDEYFAQPDPVRVRLELDYAQKLSGLTLSMADIAELLKRLEFTIDELNESYLVTTVPDHRIDVEGPHDLVEEFCRVYGYDNVPSTVIADVLPPQRGNREYEVESRIKDTLAKVGLQEIITYRLTTKEAESKALLEMKDDRPYIALVNPSTSERVVMRHNLLASVLEIVADNTRHAERIAMFEVGHEYIVDEDETLPREEARLAIVMTGVNSAESWLSTPRQLDFYDLKGALDGLFADLHINVRYEAGTHPTFRPGRTAKVYLDGTQKLLGTVGELHPLVVEQYDMRVNGDQPVIAATLDIAVLIEKAADNFDLANISQYEVIREDIAVVVDQGRDSADVTNAITKAGGFLLKDVTLFDLYTGENIPAGKKSLAYHLTYQSPNKTLKDKDVVRLRRKIAGTLKATLGATLRE